MLSNKQNISYVIVSEDMLICKIQGMVWDLSMRRICYKLTKKTAKTEKKKNPYNLKNVLLALRLFAIN